MPQEYCYTVLFEGECLERVAKIKEIALEMYLIAQQMDDSKLQSWWSSLVPPVQECIDVDRNALEFRLIELRKQDDELYNNV